MTLMVIQNQDIDSPHLIIILLSRLIQKIIPATIITTYLIHLYQFCYSPTQSWRHCFKWFIFGVFVGTHTCLQWYFRWNTRLLCAIVYLYLVIIYFNSGWVLCVVFVIQILCYLYNERIMVYVKSSGPTLLFVKFYYVSKY